MSDNLLEQLKTFLESDEGKEHVKREQEKVLFRRQHINKYVDRFHAFTKDERSVLIEKIKTKYDSDEYYNRWINRGIEPPEVLFDYILEYGYKYGKRNHIEDAYFGYDSYIIDNTWVITCWYGQGIVYNLDKINS